VTVAAGEVAARNLLPARKPAQASIIKLNTVTAAQINSFHSKP